MSRCRIFKIYSMCHYLSTKAQNLIHLSTPTLFPKVCLSFERMQTKSNKLYLWPIFGRRIFRQRGWNIFKRIVNTDHVYLCVKKSPGRGLNSVDSSDSSRTFESTIRRYDGCLCSLCRKITGLQNLRSIEELNLRRNRIRNHAAIFNLAYSTIMSCWYHNQKKSFIFWGELQLQLSFCLFSWTCCMGQIHGTAGAPKQNFVIYKNNPVKGLCGRCLPTWGRLPQSPLTGHFFKWRHFALVSLYVVD